MKRTGLAVLPLLLLVACQLTLEGGGGLTGKEDERLHPDGTVGVYHYDTWGFNGTRLGELINPTDLALDYFGDLMVLDVGNLRVQVFDPAGRVIQQYDYDFGGGERAFRPTDLAVSNQDNVYLADPSAGTVFKFTDVSTAFVVTESYPATAGTGRLKRDDNTLSGISGAPSVPGALAANWAGELWIASGEELYEFDGRGNLTQVYSPLGDDLGGHTEVSDMSMDYDRSLWVLTQDGLVVHVDYRGRVISSFPTGLRPPFALDCDGGVIAIADGWNDGFRLYHENGRLLYETEVTADDGTALLSPEGIALDYDNRRLYLANTGSHTIEVFELEVWEPAEPVQPEPVPPESSPE
jgi:DNA-binding beta-propeller fold protein YncE